MELDLKEFIVNTIKSIEGALTETVTEKSTSNTSKEKQFTQYLIYDPSSKDNSVQLQDSGVIHFDLEVASGTKGEGKLGIKVLSVEAGVGKDASYTQHSRIKFALRRSISYREPN